MTLLLDPYQLKYHLNLHWLDLNIELPLMILCDEPYNDDGFSGTYIRPMNDRLIINNGKERYPMNRGIILIYPINKEYFYSNIAHEYRHHWQYLNGWKYDGRARQSIMYLKNGDIKKFVEEYYLKSKSELDALMFQHGMYPTKDSQKIIEIINRNE